MMCIRRLTRGNEVISSQSRPSIMDPNRWRRVEELYHSALEREPERRSVFIAEACKDDEDLRRLLDDLLSQGDLTNGLVGKPVWEVVAESTEPSSEIAAGARLGPYEILGPLGEGGMGKVYRARDTRLDRPVAIKISAEQFSNRFEREARAISALNHPHVCTLYDVGPNFLVMELVEGETLAQRIGRSGPVPIEEALQAALEIAQALQVAHSKGIIHRDLKPANVKITPDGWVKVLDFGLAKSNYREAVGDNPPSETSADRSIAGQVVGTPAYMSPEQARGEEVDARTDIWAFGCVLYELLTGRRAFRAEENSDTIDAILTREPDWRALRATTPKPIQELVRTCLDKDARRRPPNMKQIRACLEEEARRRAANRWRLRTSIAAILAALLGAGLLVFRSRATFESGELLSAIPLTSYPGNENEPTFSPDGNQVAFSWDGEKQDNFDIYVKRIGAEPPLRLTHDPARETSPAWSPDGTWIAFLRASEQGRNLVVLIPAAGGPERVVAGIVDVQAVLRKNLDWSPDSKSLVMFDRPAGQAAGIWLLSLETGARRRLTTLPAGALWEGGFQFSPDGRSLAFIRNVSGNSGDLYLQSLGRSLNSVGQPRRLTHENQDYLGPVWTADGRSLIFSSGAPGNEELWRMPASEGARPVRMTAQNEVIGVALSGRSRRLVFAQSRRELDIYRVDLDSSGDAARGSTPLIVSSRYDRQPRYSPDGNKIAFVSLRSGNWQLWVSDSNGKNPVQMTFFARGAVGPPVWSPDGRQIGFVATPEGPGHAYVMNVEGGTPRKIDALGTDLGRWAWSRDGRWILFDSSQSGGLQIWRAPAGGGAAEQLTRKPDGRPFALSPDARLIYYPRPDGVWSVPVDGGEERPVFQLDRSFAIINTGLEPTRSGIYFVGGGTSRKPGTLMFYRYYDKSIHTVAGVESPSSYGLSVSPDGKHLLYSKFTGIGTDLMLVENFK